MNHFYFIRGILLGEKENILNLKVISTVLHNKLNY